MKCNPTNKTTVALQITEIVSLGSGQDLSPTETFFCWTKVHFVGPLIAPVFDFVSPSRWVSKPGWFSHLYTYLLACSEPKGHVWCYTCLFHTQQACLPDIPHASSGGQATVDTNFWQQWDSISCCWIDKWMCYPLGHASWLHPLKLSSILITFHYLLFCKSFIYRNEKYILKFQSVEPDVSYIIPV